MALSILQATGQAFTQRIIWPWMPIVLWLRQPSLDIQGVLAGALGLNSRLCGGWEVMEPGRKCRCEKEGAAKWGLPLKNLQRTSVSHGLSEINKSTSRWHYWRTEVQREEANTAKVPKPVGWRAEMRMWSHTPSPLTVPSTLHAEPQEERKGNIALKLQLAFKFIKTDGK